jgi:hypothetical protein
LGEADDAEREALVAAQTSGTIATVACRWRAPLARAMG